MTTWRWIIFWALIGPSAVLIPLNWLMMAGAFATAWRRGRREGFSFAPSFLCGIAGALACLVCPRPGAWRWAWVPPLLDPSIALLLAAMSLHVVGRAIRWPSPFDPEPPPPG